MKALPFHLTTVFAVVIPTLLSSNVYSETASKKVTDHVLITASRVEQPINNVGSSVSVLTSTEIEALGFNNVADILRTLPGIGVTNTGGPGKTTALRIRGEEGFRTKVIIDGVDVSDPTGTQVGPQIQHISSAEIERIEVLRGPQGVAYGADAGGVINIITKRPVKAVQGGLNLEYGRYNERNVSGNIRGAVDNFDYSFSASNLETDGFNARTSDTNNEEDGYENRTLNFSGGWAVTDSFELRANIRDIEAETEFDGCFSGGSTNNCLGKFDQTNYKLSAIFQTNSLSHDISASRTDVDRENFANGNSSFSTDGTIDRIEYSGKANLDNGASLVYGAEYKEEDIVPNTGDDLERNQKSIYLEWHGNVNDVFHYIIGVRNDDNEDFGSHTSYRATGSYLLQSNDQGDVKLKASAGTGFRAPSLSEIAYNNGPAAFAPAAGLVLDEETSKGFDIGIEYRTANNNFIEVVYFYQEIEDEIFFDLATFSGYLQETGTSESQGIEINGAYHLTSHLRVSGNYTYNDTETPDGQQRVRRPRHLVNAALEYSFANNRARANIHYRLSDDAENDIFGVGRVELDNYSVVGINLSYDVTNDVQVYGRVENALDEDYEEVTGFNTAGSSAFVGTRIRF